MNQKTERRVNVSMSGIGTTIGLSWFDGKSIQAGNMRSIHLEYTDGGVMESVQKALDILVPGWTKVFTTERRMSVVSPSMDNDPQLFDMIADAEEPEQFFISRHVLEFNGGQSAYLRFWESEYSRQYANLIDEQHRSRVI